MLCRLFAVFCPKNSKKVHNLRFFSQKNNMLIIVCRVLIIYLVVLFYLRVMGKRQLGELQPFELVVTLLIADIISLPMTQISMPLLFSLVPLTALVLVHYLVSLITRKFVKLRGIVNGKPVVVINQNGVQFDALKSLNMNMDDLVEGLRSCNYYKIQDIEYAIVENNGTMTVIPKSSVAPVVNQDINISLPPSSLPLNIITAGKLNKENIKISGIDNEFVQSVIEQANLHKIKDVLLFTLDSNGCVYVQGYKTHGQTLDTQYRGQGRW